MQRRGYTTPRKYRTVKHLIALFLRVRVPCPPLQWNKRRLRLTSRRTCISYPRTWDERKQNHWIVPTSSGRVGRAIQYLSHFLGERVRSERLLYEAISRGLYPQADDLIIDISAHVEHSYPGRRSRTKVASSRPLRSGITKSVNSRLIGLG